MNTHLISTDILIRDKYLRKLIVSALLLVIAAVGYAQPTHSTATTTTGNSPVGFSSTTARKAQTLIFPGDFTTTPGCGTITQIWLQRSTTSTGALNLSDLEIRMGQINVSTFSAALPTTFLPTTAGERLSVVRDGAFSIGTGSAGDWFAIPLQTPFQYNPAQTLVLDIRCNGTSSLATWGVLINNAPLPGTPNTRRLEAATSTATIGTASTNRVNLGITLVPTTDCLNHTNTTLTGGTTSFGFGSTSTTAPRKQQIMYFASDFLNAPNCGPISTIWFQRTSVLTEQNFIDFQIRLGMSTATSFDGTTFFPDAQLQLVRSGALTIPAVSTGNNNNWFAITLTTPFNYDPAQQLIVDLRLVTPGTPYSTSFSVATLSTPFAGSGFRRLEGNRPDNPALVAGSATGFQLGLYNPAGPCAVADIAPPAIQFTKLEHACGTGNVTLSGVQITDATGVPTTGANRPRIYYNRNNGTWFSQPGTLSSGTAQNGIWSFTINSADMTGLAANDIVRYFVIAQDLVSTPNVGSISSAGLVATSVNTITTFPTLAPPTTFPTPSSLGSYQIRAVLNGTYTVGPAGDFTTLTAAANAYNFSCLAGPVIFSLISNTYTTATGETFPIAFLSNSDASSINNLTIKPTLVNTVIQGGAINNATIRITAADHITLDGSINNGTNTLCPSNQLSRDLTINNSVGIATAAVIRIESNSTDAKGPNGIAIKNCNISTGNTNIIEYGISIAGTTTINNSNQGALIQNIQIENNEISRCQTGIFIRGRGSSAPISFAAGVIFRRNIITNTIRRNGIFLGDTDGAVVEGNIIEVENIAATEDAFGINAGFAFFGYSISFNTRYNNFNTIIRNNEIRRVTATGTGSTIGIGFASSLSGTNLIANNLISNVRTIGILGSNDIVAGLLLDPANLTPAPSAVFNVFHNTIHLSGTASSTTTGSSGMISSAFRLGNVPVSGNSYSFNLRNNILSNRQNMNTNGVRRSAAISSLYTIISNQSYDFNVYDVTQANSDFSIGLQDPFTQHDLVSWRNAFGGDVNSVQHAPVFIGFNNPRIDAADAANDAINNIGTPISGITTDIDCINRSATPDPGASEFGPFFWTGVASAVWENPANWSTNAVPGTGANVIIPTVLPPGAQANPTIASTVALGNIEVQTGRILTVSTAHSLTVNNVLTNDGQVRVNSGGSLVQGATGTQTGAGTYRVSRSSAAGLSTYNFWSSPISNAAVNLLGGNRFWFNPETSTASTADDANDPGWIPASGAMLVGRGYASTGAGTVNFQGFANNFPDATPLSVEIKKVLDATNSEVSMNLIGNPFPSAISIPQFISDNAGVMTGTVYFWNQQGAPPLTAGDYTIVNSVGYVGGPFTTNVSSIPSCQGFLVLKSGAVGSANVTFRNSQRVAGNNAHFFDVQDIGRVKISVNTPANLYNETLIAFKVDATQEFDEMYDSPKLSGTPHISLHSFINQDRMAIQTLPSLAQVTMMPLGFRSTESGVFTLSLKDFENLPAGTLIRLEDRKLDLFQPLSIAQPYIFEYNPEDEEQRFRLHFYPAPVMNALGNCAENASRIQVQNPSGFDWAVQLRNAELMLIGAQTMPANEAIEFTNLAAGSYTLQFSDMNGFGFEKVIEITAILPFALQIGMDAATQPTVGQSVTFTAQSSAVDAELLWSFSDGLTIAGQTEVNRIFSEAGTYSVTLSAAGQECVQTQHLQFNVSSDQSTSVTQLSELNVAIMPNPAHEFVRVVWNGKLQGALVAEVFNAAGQSLITCATAKQSNELIIQTTELPSGVYYLKLSAGANQVVKKLVIVH